MEEMEQKEQEKQIIKRETIASLYIELSKTLGQNERIKSIEYYEKMSLLPKETSKYLFEQDTLIVEREIINEKKEKQIVFELYDDENNNIGKVQDGKIHFNPKYLELTKQRSLNDDYLYNKLVDLDGQIEYKDLLQKNKDKNFKMEEEQITEYIKEERYGGDEERFQKAQQNQKNRNITVEQIAKQKGIKANNIAFVKDNSYMYRNHPELERDLFFYRDKDGVVKAEYIDENGNMQPSKYIDNSKSYMRKVVSMGKEGDSVEQQMPHQFMTTKIQSRGANVREIGISINIDMGYLEVEEARLGANGEWTSHGIEMRGRDYNSQEVNEMTDLTHKSSNPDKITENYAKVENSGFSDDGIQIDELDLEGIIERFIQEGYQREEAIDIINYMIGEERLTEEQAKSRVNDEINQKRELEREIEEEEMQIGYF